MQITKKLFRIAFNGKARIGPGGRLCPCCNPFGPPHKHKKPLNRIRRRSFGSVDPPGPG